MAVTVDLENAILMLWGEMASSERQQSWLRSFRSKYATKQPLIRSVDTYPTPVERGEALSQSL